MIITYNSTDISMIITHNSTGISIIIITTRAQDLRNEKLIAFCATLWQSDSQLRIIYSKCV